MNKLNFSVFVGHFGSGKTEMAINYAIQSAIKGNETTLIDLDIVNPFFRSSEVKPTLDEYHIKLIEPNFVRTTVDVPSLPPAIHGVFSFKEGSIIFDVGGDPDGARALGQYKEYFDQVEYNMYFVINTRRPFTHEVDDIIELIKDVERHSRLKITHLVSNTNLSYETTIDIIEEGIKVVNEVSKRTNIPLAYINVPNKLESLLNEQYDNKKFIMNLYMTKWNNQ